MSINECKLCSNNNKTINHDGCKYDYFDILKNLFKTEIYDIQAKLNDKLEECKQLQEHNNKLVKENEELKLNIKKLEDGRKAYELAPDTPPTQNTSLNRAMLIDTSNDESYKENISNKNQSTEEFSSPDEKKSFLEIPRRKKIPFSITSPNSTDEAIIRETKWISKNPLKKSNIGFSFIQPMHQMNAVDRSDSQAKAKLALSKISLNKSKKMKQTRINFNKSTDNLNNTILKRSESNDETYCDDVIMPTPQNIIFTRSSRSSNSSSKSNSISPENKIFAIELNSKEESNKKAKLEVENDTPPINSSDSVEFLPIDDEIIFVSDTTNINNFESEDSTNSCDLLEKFSLEFGKDEMNDAAKDIKPAKPNVIVNKKKTPIYNVYQITSPIRKKSEKAKRPGFDCPDCEKYYQLIGLSMSDTEIQDRMNKCSKHRKNQQLHLTPEGFWNPVFTPTQN